MNSENFKHHEKGTCYVNQENVKGNLEAQKNYVFQFESVVYDSDGLTMAKLEEISYLNK